MGAASAPVRAPRPWARFAPLAERLAGQEDTIVAELNEVQGEPVDIGGYFHPDVDKCATVMRPSATFNATLDAFTTSR